MKNITIILIALTVGLAASIYSDYIQLQVNNKQIAAISNNMFAIQALEDDQSRLQNINSEHLKDLDLKIYEEEINKAHNILSDAGMNNQRFYCSFFAVKYHSLFTFKCTEVLADDYSYTYVDVDIERNFIIKN